MVNVNQLYGPPKVGGDCLAWCSKCKMELAHVIMSMVSNKPAKVICKTCRGQHNYKRQSGSEGQLLRSARTPSAKKPSERSTFVKVSQVWEAKLAEKRSAPMRPYQVQQSFQVGEVIQHPNFGVGIVEEVKANGKMTVLFREAEKVLVHGLAKPSPASE